MCDHDTTYEKLESEDPFLYDLHVRMGEDPVKLPWPRKVELKMTKREYRGYFLNNEPYFEKGVLDQGYWRIYYTHRRVMKDDS